MLAGLTLSRDRRSCQIRVCRANNWAGSQIGCAGWREAAIPSLGRDAGSFYCPFVHHAPFISWVAQEISSGINNLITYQTISLPPITISCSATHSGSITAASSRCGLVDIRRGPWQVSCPAVALFCQSLNDRHGRLLFPFRPVKHPASAEAVQPQPLVRLSRPPSSNIDRPTSSFPCSDGVLIVIDGPAVHT